MIDAAIVGLGWWGQKIVTAVQGRSRKIRFIRGVTHEPQAVQRFADMHRIPLSGALSDVLADDRVQAVVLATPHTLHPTQIVEVARTGRAVFSEKPLALKLADAREAVETCKKHNVVLGLGTNKRFWPANRELKRLLAGGVVGQVLHVEGHYTNQNSGAHFCEWRTRPEEAPGAGMTGAGIHVLDALVSIAGPVHSAYAQTVLRKPQPDPLDTATAVLRFRNDVSGVLATVRSSTFYWRIHVFGDCGSIEALGENQVIVRRKGCDPETVTYQGVDSLLAELDAYADAVSGRAPYITTTDEMLNTVAAFEAIVSSIDSGAPVVLR
ncbi:MAG: Gfo/Idh/MocA family protein [Rhodospirillaceae bacterium]